MKKILLLLLLGITTAAVSYAQVKIGPKAGLNISSISDSDYRVAGYFGAVADFEAIRVIHIQPEILFSFQGPKDFNVFSVNIPILVKFYILPKLSVLAGPTLGLQLGKDSLPLNTLELGVAGGIEYDFAFGLFADFRYNRSLTNIAQDGTGYNNIFQIGIGWFFF